MNQRLTTLLASRNQWILAVFATYLLFILGFAAGYASLYRSQRSHFAFNSDVLRSQRQSVAVATRQEFNRIHDELMILGELQSALAGGALEEGSFGRPSRRTVSVLGPTARYTFAAQYTVHMAPAGSAVVPSFLRVESRDGRLVAEIRSGPDSPLPKTIADYQAVCVAWRSLWEERANSLKRIEATLETDTPDVWTFWDFVYFSAITQATVGYGDILPNSTSVRLIVVAQTVLSAALVLVVVNLVFRKK